MVKIALYAGHGGSDPGAVGNGLLEKDLNLAVSNAASSLLRQMGYTVLNNRTIDVDRSITADAIYANENRADAVVEIHQNSNLGAPANGSEVIYGINSAKGRELARSILSQLVALGFADRGVKTMVNANGQDALGIIRLTSMPAVVVECAFINSPSDMARFNVQDVANAVAGGIRAAYPINGGAYPGAPLRPGSSGESVRQVQRCLNNIAARRPEIPKVAEDGIFGNATTLAVVTFQRLFGLTADGIVGPLTWARIMSECGAGNGLPPYPGAPLRLGSVGEPVRQIQRCLNNVSNRHPSIPRLTEDGVFGNATLKAVIEFQNIFGLATDGVVGPATWDKIMSECGAGGTAPPFPGSSLAVGSSGESVRQAQRCLNHIAASHPSIPKLTEDGAFGTQTRFAVVEFQRIFGLEPDGVVGPLTWNAIMRECASARSEEGCAGCGRDGGDA
jgi:peptidoglycan hydrolase-like protein with peptidoglycan-binding domain